MTAVASALVCAGCGASPGAETAYPFTCPNIGVGDVDHVLVRVLDPARVAFPSLDDAEERPFVRYRSLLHSAQRAGRLGMADRAFVDLVHRLDDEVAAVDGRGFRTTPLERSGVISDALGFSPAGGVFVKDETDNVAGSHKARHLMGVLLHIEVAERLGRGGRASKPRLAVASCGNAALAAATLAAASGRELVVFVPLDAPEEIVERLHSLGATVVHCARERDEHGDPTVIALGRELSSGSLPFTCQGNLNGLAIEGGETLGYEIVSQLGRQGLTVDHFVVQVGGGALASSCAQALHEAAACGVLAARPHIHTVQTKGAHPLERAYRALARDLEASSGLDDLLARAARHRSRYMWPWESEPKSIATGILDDDTYDWLAVVRAMFETAGRALVVGEDRLARAHELGRGAGYHADPTGTAGLAGLIDLVAAGAVRPDERVVVLFTGTERPPRHPGSDT